MNSNVTGVEYLKKVLCDWEAFCEGHKPFTKAIDEVITENEQLKAENEMLRDMVRQNEGVLPKYEKLLETEASKEFAERLKKHYDEYDDYDDIYVRHIRDDIDFTLDDVVGDKNEKDT